MDASRFFGPRKARCVDFSKQTYSERYDFSTVLDRGVPESRPRVAVRKSGRVQVVAGSARVILAALVRLDKLGLHGSHLVPVAVTVADGGTRTEC